MQDKTKVIFDEQAIEGLKKGIDIVYKAVSRTLGACGRNVLFRSVYSHSPQATNDGKTIANMIDLEDENESMGADLIKQAAFRTDSDAGDGTTTSVVLSKAMIDKSFELVQAGKNPMSLKREILDAASNMVKKIKDISIPIKDDEDVFNIANISVENPEIAKIVADSVKKVGENGTVLVEESNGLSIEKEEINGLKFDKGYISPFMVNTPTTMQAVLKDVLVLVTDKQMSVNTDFIPLMENIYSRGINQLLIICENVQGELLNTIFQNRLKGVFNCVVVQKPNDFDTMEDVAIFCGAELLTAERISGGFKADHFKSLGKAQKVVVSKDSTLIAGGLGEKTKIDERIEAIKGEIKDAIGYTKDKLRERLAKLDGGVVILKVGAPTEAEMKYLKLKIDDAVGSTRAAIEEGIVIGGGKALYELSLAKPKNGGEEVVFYACQQPIKKILENAGLDAEQLLLKLGKGKVYNVLSNKITDSPIEDGLVDPAKVERCALTNAASLASILCTIHCSIVEVPKKVNSENR